MSNKKLIIILVIVIVAGIFFYIQSKKKDTSLVDSVFDLFKKKKPESGRAFIGDTSKATSNKEWLRDALGLGEVFIDRFTEKDAGIARFYIENYMRKGVQMQPTDPLYNDVVRIANYSQIFKKP